MQLNKVAASVSSYDAWPAHWDHIALRISRSPVAEGYIDHESIILDWGMPVMAMILSLANIVPVELTDDSEIISRTEGTAKKAQVTIPLRPLLKGINALTLSSPLKQRTTTQHGPKTMKLFGKPKLKVMLFAISKRKRN